MVLPKISATAFLLFSPVAMAQEAPVKLQCQGNIQRGSPKTETQMEPVSVEINGKAVKLNGVDDFETSFSLIQKDEKFYVFKNSKKTQGGNINRATGQLYLYSMDMGRHKIAVSVNGTCTKSD
jgi:hypothetical protein